MPALHSSRLKPAGYRPGTTHLPFRNGRRSTLHAVPERHCHGLLSTSSAGWYFNT